MAGQAGAEATGEMVWQGQLHIRERLRPWEQRERLRLWEGRECERQDRLGGGNGENGNDRDNCTYRNG